MTEFEQIREALTQRRREIDDARQQALLARENLRQHERALGEAARSAGPGRDGEHVRLAAAVDEVGQAADEAASRLAELRAGAVGLHEAFAALTDPREGLRCLPARHPILLLPLRLETRFKTGAQGQPQLWVRVYPDTCLVDGFEPALTEQEVTNARAFWAAVWRAGGDEPMERAAWRELVGSHGAGRAGWIARHYLPLNPSDKPTRNDASDVLLIITASAGLPAAAADYWAAVWRADNDGAAAQAAYAALEAAVGAAQARTIAEVHRPVNFDDSPQPPRTRADVRVEVTVLQLTAPDDMPTRRESWSSAPRIDLLPERLVLVGYRGDGDPLTVMGEPVETPLIAGPDPNAPPADQLKPIDDTLQIPDALAWMFDFERALAAGMAFRIDLTPEQAREGFDRVVVLGVRLADTSSEGRTNLERLLEHHLYSRPGLQLLPQGTPTNNAEKDGAGYSFRDDPDVTFDAFFQERPQYALEADPLLRRDGQRLADLLGLPHDLVQRIPGAGIADASEAQAMQIVLWPGTLGYTMTTLMSPVFDTRDIDATREFFTRYVSGRGPLPALRVGDQPYGILPVAAFARINWFGDDRDPYPARLHQLLRRVERDWTPLVERISRVGDGGGDPHQVLLDVLGLHPSSVEYFPLHADSVDHKFYEVSLLNVSVALGLLGLFPAVLPLQLLRSFGYTGDEAPELLRKIYRARQTPLTGPLIDDRPLSETDPIRNYAGDRNYIEWLIGAAGTGVEAIQREQGFDGDRRPTALLYLLLRHALQRSLHATGASLQARAGLVDDVRALLREPAFVHIRDVDGSESSYDVLFRPAAAITGEQSLPLGDYIARNVRTIDGNLPEQIAALERLSQLPTARLERLFAEHIDTVSYRLDAWKTGLLSWGLERLRRPPAHFGVARSAYESGESAGLFLGAYGWLEPLRPEGKVLTPAVLDEDLAAEINKHDAVLLMEDSTNQGLLHAPSLNHATTAAVLRNGYVANDGRLAVNLSSRRVRLALEILDGIRRGQPIGALLGYQFERHVHDHGPLQLRALIYPLRQEFPLVANQIAKTKTEAGEAQEAIAAMNVIDGRKLIERVESNQEFNYPFGIVTLPRGTADQESALSNALAHIRDINDAVADLVLAEGVHQAVLGNYDRSAGTLDAFIRGAHPPEPEVIRTPSSGIAFTLRTAIHLSPAPPVNPLPALPLTPLASAEPSVNAWLAGRLPAPANVGCQVTFTDRTTDAETTVFVDQQNLGLHPIDLVYRGDAATDQALNDLDDRILQFVESTQTPRHDRPIVIKHTDRVASKVTWFELQALLRSLRTLITASRPLQPADLMLHNDAAQADQTAATIPRDRIDTLRDDLRDLHLPALEVLAAALDDASVTIDDAITQFAGTVGQLSGYRLPQTGTGSVYEWRASTYTALTDKLAERLATWNQRLDRFDQILVNYDNLPLATADEERLTLLHTAELLISTQVTEASDPAVLRAALTPRRASFLAKRDDLQDLVDTARPTLAQLLADTQAAMPLTDFDSEPFDLAPDVAEIDRFRTDLGESVRLLKHDVTERVARLTDLLDEHDAATPQGRAGLLQNAATGLFGDDFILVPHIQLPPAAAAELDNAWQHSQSGELTRYLTDAEPAGVGRDFPVDDWLHGVARVRDKMHHWENAILIGDALPGAEPPELTPLQLPHGPDERWLGLEIPDGYGINSDRLLYTAHFTDPFDTSQPICGLMIDEWTEVIPSPGQETGVAFHFDRPNAEPPQAWLLTLPAVFDGTWSWDELLAAVNDALDSAKLRALEPVHIDTTPYGAFLPATTSAYTFPEISISNNLLRNVQIYARLALE